MAPNRDAALNQPRWRRRSGERHGEIADAAMAVFASKGFAAAKMSEIAERAGVSKGAVYRYFPTKEALFRAVVEQRGLDISALKKLAAAAEAPLDILPMLLSHVAVALEQAELRQLALMVIGESGNFPELATVWRDRVVEPALGLLMALIEGGQERGSIRPGDPRLMAMSIAGPMLMGAIWRQVVEPAGGAPVDLNALAAEHAKTVQRGLANL
jgi:AcrR family transcriptional regulator